METKIVTQTHDGDIIDQALAPSNADPRPIIDDTLLNDLLVLLRTQAGYNFGDRVARQVLRRMHVHNLHDLTVYLALLRERPDELKLLMQDLIADDLDFFLDHELLAALEATVVPRLFADKAPGEVVRVWVPGCATGAAAYIVAILLYEYAGLLDNPPAIQIFATDSDKDAIVIARKGVYPETIENALSPERLRRFFDKQRQKYHIKKLVREPIVFAVQDLLRDPPFARLDLIVCANLLGTFDQGTRKRLLQRFCYSLQPGGYLALGLGEPTNLADDQFTKVGDMPRLFQRCDTRSATMLALLNQQSAYVRPPSKAAWPNDAPAGSIGDLHRRLLAQHGATSVLIDDAYEIAHLSKPDSRLFQIPAGAFSQNLLDVVQPDLRALLRAALLSAASADTNVETPPVWVRMGGAMRQISMLVRRLHEPEPVRGYFLVIFDEHGDDQALDRARGPEAGRLPSRTQWELAVHQYEIAIEGQRIANNALQAMNEQLQTLAEELATSQDQLSSLNEELQASNDELQGKVFELTRANNDLNNLIGATGIATIFIDSAQQITRFTPQAPALFNLIPADRARPLAHVTHTLDYDELLDDIADVLRTLQSIEREVRGADGRWYLARLRPYRTADERIDGVVLMFIDITARRQAKEQLRQARDQLELRVAERTHELVTANVHLQAEAAARMRLEAARKELLRMLVTTQEDERRRIARELHDELGQSISALGIGLGVLANPAVDAGERQATLARLQQISVQIDKDMNRLAIDLRPAALDDLGLVAAVQYHVERWAEHNHIHAEFQANGLAAFRLPGEIDSVIYRMIQEALTNVLKHAAAQRVSVIMEQRNNQVSVIVEDDGCGFDPDVLPQAPNAQHRLGLLGMQERVALVGGSFTIDTTPGVGTTVFARIPVPSSIPPTT